MFSQPLTDIPQRFCSEPASGFSVKSQARSEAKAGGLSLNPQAFFTDVESSTRLPAFSARSVSSKGIAPLPALASRFSLDTHDLNPNNGKTGKLFSGRDRDSVAVGVIYRKVNDRARLRLLARELTGVATSEWLELPTGRVEVLISWQTAGPGRQDGCAALSWQQPGLDRKYLWPSGVYLENLNNHGLKVIAAHGPTDLGPAQEPRG